MADAEEPTTEPVAVAAEEPEGEQVAVEEPYSPYENEVVEWTPNAKSKRISEVTVTDLPASYQTNSKKEELTLEYVANFERQYIDLYPYRAPLLLCPLNECGVPKFICTTVRPTQLPYKALYEYDKCAAFVSDYVTYEALELPTALPRHMPSPTAVLAWQAGDCFDMSVLLCSLLLGVGYDAYVVYGYAHKKVTLADQTETPLRANKQKPPEEDVDNNTVNEYKVSRRPPLQSRFLKELDDEERAERQQPQTGVGADKKRGFLKAAVGSGEEDHEDQDEEMDELRGKRVHAWVLVLAGKRELPDNYFIEASTGVTYRIEEDPPYYAVEAIFNSANYWVNMQPRHRPIRETVWELNDTDRWEHVFIDAAASSVLDSLTGLDDPDAIDEAAEPTEPGQPTTSQGPLGPASALEGDAEGGQAPSPGATGTNITAGAATAGSGAAVEGEELIAMDTVGPDNVLDMPPSWVQRMALSPAQFESRCPGRSKEVKYMMGVLQKWAPYAMPEGLVLRLTLYADKQRTEAAEVHETYEHRRDKLAKRITRITANQIVEEFLPGRPLGLKEHELVTGVSRSMRFYPNARLDGLQLRMEELGKKTVENYVGRDDRLVYRSVTFDPASVAAVASGAKDVEPEIIKMTEKYSRNEDVPAEQDVAKRVFNLRGKFTRVHYHFGDGRITASSRVYYKESWPPTVTLVDPFAKRPADSVLREEYAALISAERDCQQQFREQERQMKDILLKRKEEEDDWKLDVSVYDTARNRHLLDADRKEDAAAAAIMHDYLTPFLPDPKSTEALDRDNALKVREACLKSLRDRLVERATIIQSRLDEENANLAKKTSTFSRNRDHADKETEDEYEQYCQKAMFRIQIIDERLKRHEKQALEKYEQMDTRLRNDPRMRALHHGL